MNLSEGTRRLALFLGAIGAILGGFASYLELKSVLNQSARHAKFEQLTNSEEVQKEQKCRLLGYEPGCFQIKLPPGATLVKQEEEDWFVKNAPKKKQGKYTDADLAEPPQTNGAPAKFSAAEMADATPLPTEVNIGDIKTINWAKGMGYAVESIQTRDDQTLYPAPLPSRWLYVWSAILPLLGFALPWALIRAVAWVGAGFFANLK